MRQSVFAICLFIFYNEVQKNKLGKLTLAWLHYKFTDTGLIMAHGRNLQVSLHNISSANKCYIAFMA